jgi:hypothetical protein
MSNTDGAASRSASTGAVPTQSKRRSAAREVDGNGQRNGKSVANVTPYSA